MTHGAALEQRLARLTPQVLHSVDLIRSGMTDRDIARAVVGDGIVRLRRGWYVAGPYWDAAAPEDRQLAAIIAARPAHGPHHRTGDRHAGPVHAVAPAHDRRQAARSRPFGADAYSARSTSALP